MQQAASAREPGKWGQTCSHQPPIWRQLCHFSDLHLIKDGPKLQFSRSVQFSTAPAQVCGGRYTLPSPTSSAHLPIPRVSFSPCLLSHDCPLTPLNFTDLSTHFLPPQPLMAAPQRQCCGLPCPSFSSEWAAVEGDGGGKHMLPSVSGQSCRGRREGSVWCSQNVCAGAMPNWTKPPNCGSCPFLIRTHLRGLFKAHSILLTGVSLKSN